MKKKKLGGMLLKSGMIFLLSAGLLAACTTSQQGTAEPETDPEGIVLTAGAYEYGPEEIMYLSGVKAVAEDPDASYSLQDTDEDGTSELFVKDKGGAVKAYRYDAESNQAKLCEAETPEALSWVDGRQWPDSGILGVSWQTGDPGLKNDFYLSANYDWLSEEHIRYAGETSGVTDDLEKNVAENRRAMFEDTENFQGEDIQRLRDYYALATNWDRRDADGVDPVKKYLEAASGISSLSELSAYLADPAKDPFCTMVGFTVTLDVTDTSHWAVQLAEDDFSVLPRAFHAGRPGDVEDSRYEFSEKAGHVLKRAGYDEETIEQVLADCYAMEDALLPLAWMEDGETSGDFLPFDEVMASCERFPLRELLNAYNITGGTVCAYFPGYLAKLDELYTEENLPMLKGYVLAHTAAEACAFLDYDAATCLEGFEEGAPRDEEMLKNLNDGYQTELLSPRGPLGVAEENAYMTYYAPADVRADLTELAEEIRAAFREILLGEDWMSDAGKAAALEKLDSMTFSVMRPDALIDSSYLAVDPQGCFLDEYVKVHTSSLRHNGAFAGQERIEGDWRYDLRPEIATTYTNAFYYGSFNQFFILAGFVDPSIYRPDMAKEEKLGKLGEIIGHELTHGFDPLGIQYDKKGNLIATDDNPSGWLPEKDFAAFQSRARKVADYFDSIRTFPNDACSGENVQGEAIADIGGMAIGLKIAEGIPGFDYDDYFRSHMELWRMQTTLAKERGEIHNEHPLRFLRINTVVQQFDEFYETYGVNEGDRMYLAPEERISVW